MIQNLNRVLFSFLNGFVGTSPVLDAVIYFCAEHLGLILVIAWVVWFLWIYRDKPGYYLEHMALILIPTVLAWVCAEILKNSFDTARPFAVLPDPSPLYLYLGSHAFPSGHATFFAAFAVAIFREHRKAGVAFAVGAVVVGLARVIAGIHWPIDIMGGFLIGSLIAWFIGKGISKILTKYNISV